MAKTPDPDLGRSDRSWGCRGPSRAKSCRMASVVGNGNHGGRRFGEVGQGLAGHHTDPCCSLECERGAMEGSEQGRPWPDHSAGGQGRDPAKLLPGLGVARMAA